MSSVAKGFSCFAADVAPRCQDDACLLANEEFKVADGEVERLIFVVTWAERLFVGDDMSIPGITISALIFLQTEIALLQSSAQLLACSSVCQKNSSLLRSDLSPLGKTELGWLSLGMSVSSRCN